LKNRTANAAAAIDPAATFLQLRNACIALNRKASRLNHMTFGFFRFSVFKSYRY
jgi:hypothetical protein